MGAAEATGGPVGPQDPVQPLKDDLLSSLCIS